MYKFRNSRVSLSTFQGRQIWQHWSYVSNSCDRRISILSILSISLTHSINDGAYADRQWHGITALAAVSQCLKRPFLILLYEPGKMDSKVICGVLGIVNPVARVWSLSIISQNLWTEGHSHQICSSEPLAEWQRQHRSDTFGYIQWSNNGHLHNRERSLKFVTCALVANDILCVRINAFSHSSDLIWIFRSILHLFVNSGRHGWCLRIRTLYNADKMCSGAFSCNKRDSKASGSLLNTSLTGKEERKDGNCRYSIQCLIDCCCIGIKFDNNGRSPWQRVWDIRRFDSLLHTKKCLSHCRREPRITK